MITITTHVLDTSLGKPAAGVLVELQAVEPIGVRTLSAATTDADGRVKLWPGLDDGVAPGPLRLVFATGDYFVATSREAFFPAVTIDFRPTADYQHYHVPLLLAPYGYSTYRGS
ncbi:MAG: hydroxyisourate hydrolase [Pirellulales bacterium]|nr:hydroxyisourate hydrolase [Pirellulales bacterium]